MIKLSYYERNKERVKARTLQYYYDNREDRLAQRKNYYSKNKEKCKISAKKTKAKNPKIAKDAHERWRLNHPEELRARNKLYRETHAYVYTAAATMRRAVKLQATPPWLTSNHKQEIEEIYKNAQSLGLHVDHIVPLQGKTVCGLHVPWNLQLLTPTENSRKSNHFL